MKCRRLQRGWSAGGHWGGHRGAPPGQGGRQGGDEPLWLPQWGGLGMFGWHGAAGSGVKSAGFARNPPGMTTGGSCRYRGCPRSPRTPQGVTPAPLGATRAGGTGRVLAGGSSLAPAALTWFLCSSFNAPGADGSEPGGAARGRLGPTEGQGPLSPAARVPLGTLPAPAGVNSSCLDLISLSFAWLSAPATPP